VTVEMIEAPTERGFPFQLVAETKWGYKWIRWLTVIGDHPGLFVQGADGPLRGGEAERLRN